MKCVTKNKASFLPSRVKRESGFTLVEMIVVIVITGIIGGIVAIFVKAPVQGYMDSARRAEMTDIADTAFRRITRDLRLALPNSVRINTSGSVYFLDFLATTGGGRYRASGSGTTYCPAAAPTNGDALIFNAADTCFEILGPSLQFQANDQVVIYNLGIPGADAYSGNTASSDVRRAYAGSTAAPVNFVTLSSTQRFPFESPAQRFQIVHEQVRYVCDPGAHTLTRYAWAGNAIVAPSATVPAGGALLATNVGGCSFSYDANVVAQQAGLVNMWLTLSESGESITLYSTAHVNNVP